MQTKIIFCHIPKTGGYSLINWFKKDLKVYELNDSARAQPLENQIQKYHESSVIEIHGGSPQSIDHLRQSVPKARELFISIIRNPVEQFESLCRDAYVHKAYLDLPLVPRNFTFNDFNSMFAEEYSEFEFNMHQIFNLYYEYWKNIKTSSYLGEDLKQLERLNGHINSNINSPVNPDYLFRRNNQFKYLMQTFGIDIVGQMLNDKENCILLTTSQLEKQFIWLLLNHPLLKPLTIFSEYEGTYKKSDIEKKLQLARKNTTPQIKNKKNLRLDTHESFLYTLLNQIDYNIWHSITCQWNRKFQSN